MWSNWTECSSTCNDVFNTENVSVPIQLLNMAGKIVSRLALRLIEDLASL